METPTDRVPALDMDKVQAFAFRILADIIGTQIDVLYLIADRLGLFQVLEQSGPVTSDASAGDGAGINERYAREWFAAMACHKTLTDDDATRCFTLPPEHAAVLADIDSGYYRTLDESERADAAGMQALTHADGLAARLAPSAPS